MNPADERINEWMIEQDKYPDDFIKQEYETMDELSFGMKYGAEIRNSRPNKSKLFYHQTDGGAEYLCMDKVEGTEDEGDMHTAILRIDGGEFEWLREERIIINRKGLKC